MGRAAQRMQMLGNAATIASQRLAKGQKEVNGLEQKLRTLKKTEANIQRFNKLQQDMQAEGNKTGRAFQSMQKQANRLGESLTNAGYPINNLASGERRLREEIAQTEQALNRAKAAQEARTRQMAAQQAAQVNYQQAQSRLADAKMSAMNAVMNIRTIAAPFVDMAKTAMTFESAMSKVKAITGGTAEETAQLTARARELGATTRWTATQTADAMSLASAAAM